MRAELHLSLWALAIAALALGTAHRPEFATDLPPGESGGGWAATLVASVDADLEVQPQVTAQPIERPLFRIDQPALDVAAAPVPPLRLPTLKGIIETSFGRHAVFAAIDVSGDAYLVVGVGETIGSLLVEQVGADVVTAKASDGEIIEFELRGSGELPN
jgi:hypothetical protein